MPRHKNSRDQPEIYVISTEAYAIAPWFIIQQGYSSYFQYGDNNQMKHIENNI